MKAGLPILGQAKGRMKQLPFLLTALPFLLIILIIFFGAHLVPNDPLAVSMADRFQSPGLEYPLGTDHMGRCIFSRIIVGAQTTLGVAALAVIVIICIGIPIGLACGYIGGKLDTAIMRLADCLLALPEFILAIAIAGFLGPSLTNLMLAIVLFKWVSYTRVVRGIVLAEREKEYILAARVSGSSTWKIMYRHLLPQIASSVLVLAALDVGKVILIISSLSYLGLGAQPPAPEWGAMLNDGRPYFQTAPQLMLYPGAAILVVVLLCNILGDWLRDTWDIKRRQ